MDKQKRNRLIAKEILLFFLSLSIIGLIGAFLLLRNQFYGRKIENIEKELHLTILEVDSLPNDKIKSLYEGLKLKFVENYKYNNEVYVVLKEAVPGFLKSTPQAKRIEINPNGYTYFSGLYPYYELHNNEMLPYPPPKNFDRKTNDSTIVFNYVTLDEFRFFIDKRDYRDKLYQTFSKYFELGEKSEFEEKLTVGLSYKPKLADSLINRGISLKKTIGNLKYKKMNNDEMIHLLYWIAFFIGIAIYPIRIIYYIIRWAIVTIKQNEI